MFDLYSSSLDDQWRYLLGKSGKNPLLVIGLNPSKATQHKPDPTVSKVKAVAQMNSYDGFLMLNLYPVRATDWRMLPFEADRIAFNENIESIIKLVGSFNSPPTIWAAWGESVMGRPFFREALLDLVQRLKIYDVKWVHLGEFTGSGHPRHPSRLSYSWRFSELDIGSYSKSINV